MLGSALGNSAEQKWGQVQNYHIALDSGKLGIEKCVELLAELYPLNTYPHHGLEDAADELKRLEELVDTGKVLLRLRNLKLKV